MNRTKCFQANSRVASKIPLSVSLSHLRGVKQKGPTHTCAA